MKLKTFFDKFDQLADAPDAVAKMRELVLELAVQGKLSNERSGAETSVVENGMPFAIPSDWKWTTLEKLGEIKPRNNVPDDAKCAFVPMASIPAKYGCQPRHEERLWGELKKSYTHFKDRDVVMAKITPCFENGKSAVLNGLTGGVGAGTTELHVFRRHGATVLPEFVLIYLKSPGFIARGVPQMTGSAGQKRVPTTYFATSPFPLAPLAEQKRIVTKVDELMALCERLETQQKERETKHTALASASLARFADAPTPTNLNFLFHKSYTIPPADFRKSILTLAVQGKLVRQDPNDPNTRDVIDHAMEKRTHTIRSKSLRRKALDESVELISEAELPSSWCVERFANLVDPENTISYGVLVPGSDVASGIPFVRVQDLSINNPAKLPNKTIAPEIEKPYARTRLRGGEILLCVVGATIGRLGVAPASWAGANIARAVARISPIAEVNRDYLLLVLRSPQIQSYFTTTTRTLAQPTLNVGAIEQTPIPLPPLAEQRRIAAKVDQLMALVDHLETQLAASRTVAERLMEAVIAELFSLDPMNRPNLEVRA